LELLAPKEGCSLIPLRQKSLPLVCQEMEMMIRNSSTTIYFVLSFPSFSKPRKTRRTTTLKRKP
jgi:hypothetical protein